MIICFTGPLGGGKTLQMVHWALVYAARANVPVYANFELKNVDIETHRIKNSQDIIEMARAGGGILLIDEAYKQVDARFSMKPENVFMSQFMMYLRKIGATAFFSAQTKAMLDVRIRDIVDLNVLCYRGKGYNGFIYDGLAQAPISKYNIPEKTAKKIHYKVYDTFEMVEEWILPAKQAEFKKFMKELEAAQKEARQKGGYIDATA